METLRRQIARAHRRLLWTAFASRLWRAWFATLALAALAIALGKRWPLADDRDWALVCLAVAVVLGTAAAVVWTWIARQTPADAAAEIDRRFGLKERVASTFALTEEELATPIGQALVRDASSRLARLDVTEQFRLRFGPRGLWPVAPAAVALAIALGIGSRAAQSPVQAAAAAERAQVQESARALVKRLDEQRRQAADKGLEEADDLLQQLERGIKELAQAPQTERRGALVALNELTKEAEKRRQELAGSDLRQQLQQLKNDTQGPAKGLEQALKNGDLAKAVGELDKLAEALRNDKLPAEEREALARQMDELRQALENKAAAHEQARQELQRQLDAERRQGHLEAAQKLEQQLDKLAGQAPQMEKLGSLARQMKQAAEAARQGKSQQAAEALSEMGRDLEQAESQLAEMDMLDATLEELADCKNAMTCKECKGQGCKACRGGHHDDEGQARSHAGLEPGRAVGRPTRPGEAIDAELYDSQVKQDARKGPSVVTGTADGPNRKGAIQQSIQEELDGGAQQAAEALSGQRLPRDYRDHAKKYFDALREGQPR